MQRQRKYDFKAQTSSLSSDCTWLELRLVLNGMTTSSLHSSCFLNNQDPPSIFLLSFFPFIIFFPFLSFSFLSFFFFINLISSPNLFLTNPLTQLANNLYNQLSDFSCPKQSRGHPWPAGQGGCRLAGQAQMWLGFGPSSAYLFQTLSLINVDANIA